MTEEKKQIELTPEQQEILQKGVERAALKTVEIPVENKKEIPQPSVPKYPNDLMCRCKMRFFLQNGTEYQNEINITMDKIAMIQQQMSASLENKEGTGVIYLEGSKNCAADFTVIPVKNILYVKFEVEDLKKG